MEFHKPIVYPIWTEHHIKWLLSRWIPHILTENGLYILFYVAEMTLTNIFHNFDLICNWTKATRVIRTLISTSIRTQYQVEIIRLFHCPKIKNLPRLFIKSDISALTTCIHKYIGLIETRAWEYKTMMIQNHLRDKREKFNSWFSQFRALIRWRDSIPEVLDFCFFLRIDLFKDSRFFDSCFFFFRDSSKIVSASSTVLNLIHFVEKRCLCENLASNWRTNLNYAAILQKLHFVAIHSALSSLF